MAGFKEINIEDISVKVPDQGFASEETLQELVRALGGRTAGGGAAAGGAKAMAGATKGAGKDVKAFGKSLYKMNPALTALETGFNLLGNTITGTMGLIKSMATMDGSFESLNSVVDFGVDQITKFTSMIPILGGLLTAAAETTGEMMKLRLAFMQLQQESFQKLADTGLRLSGPQGLGGTLETALRANISIETFGNLVMENADGLRIFGGTINNAAATFATRLEALTDQNSEVGMGLRMLGMNSTAIAEEFTDFVTTNRLNSALMTGGEKQLNNELLKRSKNERIIAELTGKNIKEQRAAQMAAVADSAFQAAIAGMGEEGAELTTFVAGLPGPIGDAVKQIIAFGTVTNEESARLIATIPGLRETLENNIEGIKSGNVSSSKAVADTIQLGQNAIEDGNGLFLAKLAMIDPAFQAVADFIMQGRASSIQLKNINDVLDESFTDLGDAQAAFNTAHESQLKTAEDLARTGKLTEERLREEGITDDKTIAILLNAVKVEDAVGSFQAGLFGAVNNLDLLDVAIDGLIDTMNDAIRMIDPDYVGPNEYRKNNSNNDLSLDELQNMAGAAENGLMNAGFMNEFRVNEAKKELIASGVSERRVNSAGDDMTPNEIKEYDNNMKKVVENSGYTNDPLGYNDKVDMTTTNDLLIDVNKNIKKLHTVIHPGLMEKK